VAAQIVLALQLIVSRVKKPVDPAVVSVTMVSAGEAINVIPDTATLRGTVRTFSDEMTTLIEREMTRIAQLTAEAHGASAHVTFKWNYPPTINHAAETEFAAGVLDDIVGATNVVRNHEQTMGAEDFSFLLKARPGCYVFIGNGDGSHRAAGHGLGPCMLHNPTFDFNDDLIPLGATYWVRLTETFLR
jgi:hippurate hydrolase